MLRTTTIPPRPLWSGLDYGPALVVLDSTDVRPKFLHPSWTPLAESFQIAWCATPGPDTGPEAVEDVLETLADRRVRTQLVVGDGLADFAAGIAVDFPGLVRTLAVAGDDALPALPGVRAVRLPRGPLTSPAVVASVLAELGWAHAGPGAGR